MVEPLKTFVSASGEELGGALERGVGYAGHIGHIGHTDRQEELEWVE
jgi:hypothetical protein